MASQGNMRPAPAPSGVHWAGRATIPRLGVTAGPPITFAPRHQSSYTSGTAARRCAAICSLSRDMRWACGIAIDSRSVREFSGMSSGTRSM
eukprot:CAMPEP_0195103184 /NCGR_PEP_ID=MMETSP0448-20130528/71345_1 /TAXON_ID=66468 /ORGANISM="Heterocapsa triquestra, Strain CCMP 448" /LENGTH=90 /DNA_ID=CAMNT_0040138817 /DNA_START=24 /DNA_END=293 /DNA_ORIENTATION=+